jgi:hypothetical protein
VVEQLNQDTIGIVEVERAGAIAMGLRRICKRYVQFPEPACPNIDISDLSYNKSDMVDALDRTGLCTFGELMDGEIVGPGGQVNVFFVRLPLHTHPKNRTVKVNGSSNIANIQSNMSQPQRFH